MWTPLSVLWHEAWDLPPTREASSGGSVQWDCSSAVFCPIRAGGTPVGWVWWAGTAEPSDLVNSMYFSVGWSRHPVASLRGRQRTFPKLVAFILTPCRCRDFETGGEKWRRPPPSKEWAPVLKAVPGKRSRKPSTAEQKKWDASFSASSATLFFASRLPRRLFNRSVVARRGIFLDLAKLSHRLAN